MKNYFESIRDKDIVASFNLRESAKFERLAHYLISNTARFVSAKRIGGIIGLSTTAVNNYLDYAEQVYWFLQLKNFSFSIKGQITSQRKIYAIDTGFITSTAFSFSENIGRILENIIFLQLKMDEKNIYFHKESKECDFIIKQGTKVIQAIQVAYDLKDEDTRKREIDGLIDAMDHHGLKSGLIITSEEEGTLKIDGKKIKIMKAWKWLLSGR